MFAGIIEQTGRIESLQRGGGVAKLRVASPGFFAGVRPGASVAVSGVCLTVVEHTADTAAFDVVPETLAKTTLGGLRPGDRVNLEPGLRAGEPIDGHFVQGHVEGVGTVVRIDRSAGYVVWTQVPAELMPAIVPKGSIAIDGVSLTVVEVDRAARTFSVALIPTTLERTTLGELREQSRVNVETDILARIVVVQLAAMGLREDTPASGITLEKLRSAGFVE